MEKIGGTPEERGELFDELVAKYPGVFWIEGCPAPTVKNKWVHFSLKLLKEKGN